MDYIFGTVMPAVDPAFGGGLDPDGWLIDRLVNDYKELPEDDWVQIDITRRQWLVGVTAGTDILTAKAHPRKWWKHKAALMYWGANGEHRLRGAGALERLAFRCGHSLRFEDSSRIRFAGLGRGRS